MVWFWGPRILLKPLTHRFLRGATQLLGRAIAFVIDGLDKKLNFGVTVNVNEKSSHYRFRELLRVVLLKNPGKLKELEFEVIGCDNINSYYSTDLKQRRLDRLKGKK